MDYVLDLDFAVFPMTSVVISLGIFLCVVITASLYARRREGITAALMLSVLSIVFGVVAFSSLWGIHEVFQQHKRVQRGWFPMNPKRKKDYEK